MDKGVWRFVLQVERIHVQSLSVVQAVARYPASSILCYYVVGDQFSHLSWAGPRAETHILRQQSFARVWGVLSGHRKGGSSHSICSTKALPLLPEFHCNCNEKPTYTHGLTEAWCGRANGALDCWVVRVRYTVWTKRTYQGLSLWCLRGRNLLSGRATRRSKLPMGSLCIQVL